MIYQLVTDGEILADIGVADINHEERSESCQEHCANGLQKILKNKIMQLQGESIPYQHLRWVCWH